MASRGNPRIAQLGAAYRWQEGTSGNPGGKVKHSSISLRVRSLLSRKPEILDAVSVLGAAGEDIAEWVANGRLSYADLVARAVLGIALGRGGDKNVPMNAQLKAVGLIWGYVDGRPPENPVQQLDDAASEQQQQLTMQDFRAAIDIKSRQDDAAVTGETTMP
jgi:hypothetical protein